MRQNFIFIWIFRLFGLFFCCLFLGCETKMILEPNQLKQLEDDDYQDFYLNKSSIVFDNQLIQDTLSLINLCRKTINWKIIESPDWVIFSESHGKIGAKNSKEIFISIDLTRARDGFHAPVQITTDVKLLEFYIGYFLEKPITSSIREKADQIVVSKVGNEFFSKNIQFNSVKSRYYPPDLTCLYRSESCASFLKYPNFLMVYDFKITEKPFVTGFIEFALDTIGNIIESREIIGLPDCLKNPVECSFSIDEAQAKLIAQSAGFETGIKTWEISFYWYAREFQTYVWSVTNTLYEINAGLDNYQAGGKTLIIDANTGDILAFLDWTGQS